MPDNGTNIENLLQLAQDRSTESRTELVTVIQDLFGNKSDILTDREKNLMFKIIESLIHEVEVSIRSSLSEQLSAREDVPESLAVYLANDEISVAYPILTSCDILKDEDLIKIIHQRAEEYHLAITLRQGISMEVSEALVDTGHEDVIVSLLNNGSAKISDSIMDYLVEQSRRVDTFQDPLIHREDLKQALAEKMFAWVSDALRNDIASKFDLSQDVLDDLLMASADTNTSRSNVSEEELPEATAGLIEQLKDEKMLTPEVLLASLSQGEIALFLGLFSEMTKLNISFIKEIIFDGAGEELAVMCKAIELNEMQFITIYKKTRKSAAPNKTKSSQEHTNKMLAFFRTMNGENAKKAIETWNVQFSDDAVGQGGR